MGRDVSKLKGKGGGKFKYMAEKDMLELAAKFAPYRYVWPCPCGVDSVLTWFIQESIHVVYVAD